MDLPVKKDDVVDIEIIDMSHEGLGVGKIDGFTIFINDGIVGDKGKAKITKVKKNFAEGKMLDIYEPSIHRIESKCKISHLCGGCQFQELDYNKQLEIKTNKVINDIRKIAKLEDTVVHPTIGMDSPFRYRNKGQVPVGIYNDKTMIGFYKKGSHEIVDTKSCIIQHELNDKVIEIVKEFMEKYDVKGYDKRTNKGVIRHILTKVSFRTNDLMIIIVTNTKKIPYKDELIDTLTSKIPNIKSIVQNINTKKTNLVMGEKNITIYGEDKIIDYIGDLKFKISPQSFFQVNPIQTEVLYNKALEYADLKGNETVFDIYCGIGTISLFLSKKAKKVYGIEVVEQAIKDARENAKLNNIENVELYDGTAEDIFPKLYDKGIKADVVVLDPPRKGCDELVLDTIVKMQPKKVVYVSCNPSTLARDLKYLSENGYKALEVQPVDMFPGTSHVECVVLMSRIDK
ncbi:23S rRNA (uracil-5-)-methyltransferase RumA [Gottschalkia purinilytica]|uniref:23S rRNA (Uracil-5-)-methyltransferase RumA n=1 Tax=Gottschalkia purinilytica TaxID=1503 RepID=A0A0L0WCD2_GOTPU|nr:23S rRNA (uracil(1939)-C(5))-methyltransferase RlmD [Gottschalkia purinilytica]KNF09128.1 23S rRNA (uracil-5-)-methyltransferase RumA [Gottschalkia purinilytica]